MLKLMANYANPYEAAHKLLSGSEYFNKQDWETYALRGELDQYISILSEADKLPSFSALDEELGLSEMDTDRRYLAMANELTGDRTNSVERFEQYNELDEQGNLVTKERSIGEMSDYDYNRHLLKQYTELHKEERLRKEEQQRKDEMSGFVKFLNTTFVALPAEVVMGAVDWLDDITQLMGAISNGLSDSIYGGNFLDGIRRTYTNGDWRLFDSKGWTEAIRDWEARNSFMRDINGNYTAVVGNFLGSVAYSLGEALPTMVLNASIGKAANASVTASNMSKDAAAKIISRTAQAATAIYYTGMGSGTARELFNDPRMASVPTEKIILNAAVKTAVEWIIQKQVSVVFGASTFDHLRFGEEAAKITGKTLGRQAFKRVVHDFLNEGTEEMLQQYSNWVVDRFFALDEKNFGQMTDWNLKTMATAFVVGGLSIIGTNILMPLATHGIDRIHDFAVRNKGTTYARADIDTITDTGLKERVQTYFDEHPDQDTVYVPARKWGVYKADGKSLNAFTAREYKLTLNDMLQEFDRIKNDKTLTPKQLQDSVGQMYTLMRTLATVYSTVGEDTFKAAVNMLEQMKAYDFKMFDTAVTQDVRDVAEKAAQTFVDTLDLADITDAKNRTKERIKKKLEKAKVTNIDEILNKEDIDTDDPEIKAIIENFFKNNPDIDNVALTDGATVVIDEETKTAFIPLEYIKQEGVEGVMKVRAEQALVEGIAAAPKLKYVIDLAKKVFTELTNTTDADEEQVIYNLCFNDTFQDIMLAHANREVYNFIVHLDQIEEAATSKSVKDAVYKERIKNVRNNLAAKVALYLIYQQSPNMAEVNNLTILNKDQKAYIARMRWSRDLRNRVIDGTELTTDDKNLLTERVNHTNLDQDTKIKLLDSLFSENKAARQAAMATLERIYENEFNSPYDNRTYLRDNTLPNIIFNEFLQQSGLTLKTMLTINKNSDLYKNVQLMQGDEEAVTKPKQLAYLRDRFKEFTKGRYDFTVIKGQVQIHQMTDSQQRGFNKTTGKTIRAKVGRDINTRTFVTPGGARKYINSVINPNVDSVSRQVITLRDLMLDQELLTKTARNEIISQYDEVTPETTFLYLRNKFLEDSGGTTSIVVTQDGDYALVSVEHMRDIFVDPDMTLPTKTETDISDYIKADRLTGRLADVKVRLGENNQYIPTANVIEINKNSNDAEFRFALAHEFQHAVQVENELNGGIDAEWLTNLPDARRRAIIKDIRAHRPDLFEGIKQGSDDELVAATMFVYDTSGETQAYGTEGMSDIINFYPTIVNTLSNGQRDITMPWGTKWSIDEGAIDLIDAFGEVVLSEAKYLQYYNAVKKYQVEEQWRRDTADAFLKDRAMGFARNNMSFDDFWSEFYVTDIDFNKTFTIPTFEGDYVELANTYGEIVGVEVNELKQFIFNAYKNKHFNIGDNGYLLNVILGEHKGSADIILYSHTVDNILNKKYDYTLDKQNKKWWRKYSYLHYNDFGVHNTNKDVVLSKIDKETRELQLKSLHQDYFGFIPYDEWLDMDIPFVRHSEGLFEGIADADPYYSAYIGIDAIEWLAKYFDNRPYRIAYIGTVKPRDILAYNPQERDLHEVFLSPETIDKANIYTGKTTTDGFVAGDIIRRVKEPNLPDIERIKEVQKTIQQTSAQRFTERFEKRKGIIGILRGDKNTSEIRISVNELIDQLTINEAIDNYFTKYLFDRIVFVAYDENVCSIEASSLDSNDSIDLSIDAMGMINEFFNNVRFSDQNQNIKGISNIKPIPLSDYIDNINKETSIKLNASVNDATGEMSAYADLQKGVNVQDVIDLIIAMFNDYGAVSITLNATFNDYGAIGITVNHDITITLQDWNKLKATDIIADSLPQFDAIYGLLEKLNSVIDDGFDDTTKPKMSMLDENVTIQRRINEEAQKEYHPDMQPNSLTGFIFPDGETGFSETMWTHEQFYMDLNSKFTKGVDTYRNSCIEIALNGRFGHKYVDSISIRINGETINADQKAALFDFVEDCLANDVNLEIEHIPTGRYVNSTPGDYNARRLLAGLGRVWGGYGGSMFMAQPGVSRRIRKSEAAENKRLMPFYKTRKLVDPDVQAFIVNTNAMGLEPEIEAMITGTEAGTLTKTKLLNWLRDTDHCNDYTFNKIRKYFFPEQKWITRFDDTPGSNEKGFSLRWVEDNLRAYYALRAALRKYGYGHLVDRRLTPKSIFTLVEQLCKAKPAAKQFIELKLRTFEKYRVNKEGEGGYILDVKDSDRRQAIMKKFDGSIYSGGYLGAVDKGVAIMLFLHPSYRKDARVISTETQIGEDITVGDTIEDKKALDEFTKKLSKDILDDDDFQEAAGDIINEVTREQMIDAILEYSAQQVGKMSETQRAKLRDTIAAKSDDVLNNMYVSLELGDMFGVDIGQAVPIKGSQQTFDKEVMKNKVVKSASSYQSSIIQIGRTIANNLSPKEFKKLPQDIQEMFEDGKIKPDIYRGKSHEELRQIQSLLYAIKEKVKKGDFDIKADDTLTKEIKRLQRELKSTKKALEATTKELVNVQTKEVSFADYTFTFETNQEMPDAMKRIFNKTFSNKLVDTKVKYLTPDGEKHLEMNYKSFIDENAQALAELTQADVDAIIEYCSTALLQLTDEHSYIQYQAAEMFLLSTIMEQARNGAEWVLSADQITKIEKTLKTMASTAATILTTFKTILPKLNPAARIVKAMAMADSIEFDEKLVNDMLTALNNDDIVKAKEIKKKMYEDVLAKAKTFKVRRKLLDKLLSWERMCMLSSPGTWARNFASNVMLKGSNLIGDAIGHAFDKISSKFRKPKTYSIKQYTLTRTNVDNATYNFVKNRIIDSGLLDLIQDGINKYDTRQTSKSDIASRLTKAIMRSVENEVFSSAWNSKAMNKLHGFMQIVLSDNMFIQSRAKAYIGRMLVEDNVDITQGITEDVERVIVDAYTLAAAEYMHKPNAFSRVENTLRQKSPVAYFAYKQLMPFAAASWNWFVESLNYTPVGLIKGIVELNRIEKTINKIEDQRQKGENVVSSRFTKFLALRDIGKGMIGTVTLGIGLLLGGLGLAGIDDEDDKLKLRVGDTYLDISQLTGTSGLMLGIALMNPRRGNAWQMITDVCDQFFSDSVLDSLYNTFRYSSSTGEAAIDLLFNTTNMFFPNVIKLIANVAQINKVQYHSGFIGQLERFAANIPGVSYAFPTQVDPYTGETQTKYSVPFIMDLVNRGTPFKVYNYRVSENEKRAIALGVKRGSMTGNYSDIGKLNPTQLNIANEMYGRLNSADLTEFFNNQKAYRVQMPTGTYRTLRYSQMTDKQRKAVVERIMSQNATYAKIYVYTTEMNGKYYASTSEYAVLKKLGIIKNVYRAVGEKQGFAA